MAWWVRTLLLLVTLASLIRPAWGEDMLISREVSARGDDVTTRLDSAVTEMKRQLATQGCDRIAVAYWSESIPLKHLRVEVRCRDGEKDDSVAALPGEDRR